VRVQLVLDPLTKAQSWTVVGDDLLPIAAVDDFLSYLTVRGCSPLTVRTYAHSLATFLQFLAETDR
jgi:hypothetical protein